MRRQGEFDDYDKEQIQKARTLLNRVYEYNYKAVGMRNKQRRLETILKKIDELLKEA